MRELAQTLASALMSLPQAERGGIVASDRFDYQKDWTLCKLLELHESGNDYVIVCEFHEDVSVLDHPLNPTSVTFYQIKTDESKKWTVTRLTKRTKGRSTLLPSILGKLCGKKITAESCTVLYRFASNARYNIRSISGDSFMESDSFTLAHIHKDELNKLIAALTDELQTTLSSSLLSSVQFEIGLALESHSDITIGKLATFVENHAPGCAIRVSAFYRAIFDEIRRRTSAPRPTTSLSDMCKAKGISRINFNKMISDAVESVPEDRTWLLIAQDLSLQGIPLGRRVELDRAFRQYFVRQLNPEDLALSNLRKRALSTSTTLLATSPNLDLLTLAQSVYTQLSASQESIGAALRQDEFLAMVMVEIYEGQEPEVPSAGTQPPQAQP